MLAMFQALYRANGNLDVIGAVMQRLWCFRKRVSQNVYNLFCCNRYDVFLPAVAVFCICYPLATLYPYLENQG